MKFQLELTVQTDEGTSTTEVITLERQHLCDDTLGLSLDEAKSLLAQLQQQIVAQQVDAFINAVQTCECGQTHTRKGHHTIRYQTLFGKLQLSSPRFYTCDCQNHPHKSYSPLRQVLKEGITPELLYLQSKWASLMSYGMTADLINDVLPITTNHATIYNHTQQIAQRLEDQVQEEVHWYHRGLRKGVG